MRTYLLDSALRLACLLPIALVGWLTTARGAAAGQGKGYDMDYGPFQCYTVGFPDRTDGNLAVKGVAVRVGAAGEAAVCFDTELMRYLAGWTGGFLDRSDTHLTSAKGTIHARIEGEVQFQTRPGPGWGVAGDLADPRQVTPGALPRSWAHYKGLYRHGRRVVLSYEVAGCAILETPDYETADGFSVFTRGFQTTVSREPLTLLICDGVKGAEGVRSLKLAPENVVGVADGKATVVGLAEAPAGARLEVLEGGRVLAHFKPFASPATFKVMVWRGPVGEAERLAATLGEFRSEPDLKRFCLGGEALWGEPVLTRGRRGLGSGAYVVDTLTVPYSNPWNSWMRLISLDFFPDGRAAVSTWNGDVWVVSGIDRDLGELRWKRYAAGLFEGLGLKIVDGLIHVVERSQITRLHDLNGDGEADFYENFNNDAPAGPSYHAFAFGLDTDSEGNFYYTRCGHRVAPGLPLNGGMIRVSRDGARSEMFATGMRAPNGMSIGPGDVITASDNQGNWVPSSRVNLIEPGGFYGYMPHARRPEPPTDYDKPICWLPIALDNSSGGQVWVSGDRWGPFQGDLLHTSYGKSALFHVMLEKVDGQVQGGVTEFPLRFASGIMRGRFNDVDGQLYLCGLGGGWQTSGVREGALQRVRYTGKPAYRPAELHVKPDGIEIVFTDELDEASAQDHQNYAVEQWNYRWTEGYGSKDYSVANPAEEGRDQVPVLSAELAGDGRTVFLGMGELRPVMQMRIQFRVRARDGGKVAGEIFNTINRVPRK